MEKLSAYNIAFKGIKPGRHEFDYKIDSRFFDLFNESFVNEGEVDVKVILEKEALVYSLDFIFRGYVTLLCDRCLEYYNHPVSYETRAYIKFDDGHQEEDDEIIWLSHDDHQVNVSHLIYEYIVLSLPIKHVHPDGADGKSLCDPEMLKKLEQLKPDIAEPHHDNRWEELKKLINNN